MWPCLVYFKTCFSVEIFRLNLCLPRIFHTNTVIHVESPYLEYLDKSEVTSQDSHKAPRHGERQQLHNL